MDLGGTWRSCVNVSMINYNHEYNNRILVSKPETVRSVDIIAKWNSFKVLEYPSSSRCFTVYKRIISWENKTLYVYLWKLNNNNKG